MSKITLHLSPVNGGPFNCMPARAVELELKEILANDVALPGESSMSPFRLYVIGNEFGPCGAVWAENEQDAFDELCDAGLSAGLMVEPKTDDEREECTYLGNAGEPHCLDYAWIQTVEFVPERDWKLLCAFAEARGMNAANLDF